MLHHKQMQLDQLIQARHHDNVSSMCVEQGVFVISWSGHNHISFCWTKKFISSAETGRVLGQLWGQQMQHLPTEWKDMQITLNGSGRICFLYQIPNEIGMLAEFINEKIRLIEFAFALGKLER